MIGDGPIGCGDSVGLRENASLRRMINKRNNALIARSKANRAKRAKARGPIPPENRAQTHLDRMYNRIRFEREARTQTALAHSQTGVMSEARLDFQIGDEIDTETELTILTKLRMNPDVKEIILTFDSNGGFVRPSQNIFAALLASPAKKTGVVVGRCCSAAVLMLMACDERLALAGSTFMIHGTSAKGELTAPIRMGLLASDRFELDAATRLGIDPEKWKALSAAARNFDSSEALELKLLTRVIGADEDIDPLYEQSTEDDEEEIEIPDIYEVEVGDGNVVQFPLDARIVKGILRGGGACYGLPRAYLDVTRMLAGLPPL